MRMLKYAILGLVARQPMTGYDIKKSFDGNIARFWTAKHSQIYPELNALQNEGLVSCSVSIQGVKMEKKYYTITPEGTQALLEWIKRSDPIEPVQKEAFRLKLYFGDHLTSRNELAPMFREQYRQYVARLHTNMERIKEVTDPIPQPGSSDLSEYLLARGGILRDQAYLEWMRECAQLLEIPLDDIEA